MKSKSPVCVNIIGAGKVGRTLARVLSSTSGCLVQDVLSASFTSAREAVREASGRAVEHYAELRPAGLWVLAVPDTQISAVAQDLAEALDLQSDTRTKPVAVHCSGFFSAEEMVPLRRLNWKLASMHPVMSFSDPEVAQSQFNGALCGVEGDDEALAVIQPLMESAGVTCFPINSDKKSLYHAAAVFSNNFAVVLQAIAREAWAAADVPEPIAQRLNEALLRSTYENVSSLGPCTALTGPAARGDEFVVNKQTRDVTEWQPAAGRIYRELSELAKTLKTTGGTC